MLTDYIQAAMRHAHYEIWAEEDAIFGTIPGFQYGCNAAVCVCSTFEQPRGHHGHRALHGCGGQR